MGLESSAVRASLVEAAMPILNDEGIAALTTSRLAAEVGLTRYIVHYYFGKTEDLLVAVMALSGERNAAALKKKIKADPLRAIMEMSSAPRATAMVYELTALALRNPTIRNALQEQSALTRKAVREALQERFPDRDRGPAIPIDTMIHLVSGISSTIALDQAVGTNVDHSFLLKMLARWIDLYNANGEIREEVEVPPHHE